MKKDRSAALPLLFAGLILTIGVAALLLPLFDCPPCQGFGLIFGESSIESAVYGCTLCGQHGRLRWTTRVFADPSPDTHRGDLLLTTSSARWEVTGPR